MDTFAETEIVDYSLSFADQGKQTSIFGFRFALAENKKKLPFSVSSVFRLRDSGNVETWTWRH
jgi:hypothetical protein